MQFSQLRAINTELNLTVKPENNELENRQRIVSKKPAKVCKLNTKTSWLLRTDKLDLLLPKKLSLLQWLTSDSWCKQAGLTGLVTKSSAVKTPSST